MKAMRILLGAALAVVLFEVAASRYTRVARIEQWLLTFRLSPGRLGDAGPATGLLLCNPMGLALDGRGALLLSDRGRGSKGRVVWRIDADGFAHIFAGTGRHGAARATTALDIDFERPESLAVAADGSVYVSDGFNHTVFRIDPSGAVTRVAGTGVAGYAGDGGPGVTALLHRPADLRLDEKGNLYISDVRNHCVRRLDPSGRITTVAGQGGERGFSPDGTLAVEARLDTPWGIGLDREERLLIGDCFNHRVRRVEHDGRLATIAGSGRRGYAGDGGPATEAELNCPEALFVAGDGRIFIGDELNHAIRVVEPDGRIDSVVGTGKPGRATIGQPAKGSPVNDPEAVVVTPAGDVIVTDGENGRVLKISPSGTLELLAGVGDISACASRW